MSNYRIAGTQLSFMFRYYRDWASRNTWPHGASIVYIGTLGFFPHIIYGITSYRFRFAVK